jgi:adenylate cyclase, class 2
LVEGLGTFVEVEAIDNNGDIGVEKLKQQCSYYAEFLEVLPEDYVSHSYSDMLLQV